MCATVEYSDGSRHGNVFILRALKVAACECVFLCSAICSGYVNVCFCRMQNGSGHVNVCFCRVQGAMGIAMCVSAEYKTAVACECVFLQSAVWSVCEYVLL